MDKSSNTDNQTLDIVVIDKGTPPDAKISSDPKAVNGTITAHFHLKSALMHLLQLIKKRILFHINGF